MRFLRFAVVLAVWGVMLFGGGGAAAQAFPSKTIRILTTGAGGASDLPARLLAKELQTNLGQPVVVDNRALIGVELAAQAPADGYTLLHYTSPLWIIPLFRRSGCGLCVSLLLSSCGASSCSMRVAQRRRVFRRKPSVY